MVYHGKIARLVTLFVMGWIFCFSVASEGRAADMECDDQSGRVGATVTFTLWVDSAPNDVSSLGLEVRYNPHILRYNGYFDGSLVSSFDFFGANDLSPGIVKVGGFASGEGQQIREGESGSVVSLEFEVVGHDDCLIRSAQLKDDIRTWSTRSGFFTGDHEYEEEMEPDVNPAEPGSVQEPATTSPMIASQAGRDTFPSTASLNDIQDPSSDETVIVVTGPNRAGLTKGAREAPAEDREITVIGNASLKKKELSEGGQQIVKQDGNEKRALQRGDTKRIVPSPRNRPAGDVAAAVVEKGPRNRREERPRAVNGHREAPSDRAQTQAFSWRLFLEITVVLCGLFLIVIGLRGRKK